MGTNVQLNAATVGGSMNSANYNTNFQVLNNAGAFSFVKGSVSQLVAWSAAGFGTFSVGVAPTGVNIAGCTAQYAVAVNNSFHYNIGCRALADTTVLVSADIGDSFKATAWKT